MSQKTNVDVLLLTAVHDEYEQIKRHVHPDTGAKQWEEIEDAHGYPLLRGAFLSPNQEALHFVVGRCPKMGVLAAQGRALQLADEFNIQCLAMCGVCAGNPAKNGLKEGDVIVAKEVWRYGPGKKIVKHLADGDSEDRQEDIEVEPTNPDGWDQHAEDFGKAFRTEFQRQLQEHYPPDVSEPYDFSVYVGAVQTVHDVTIDEQAFDDVKSIKRGTIALEMEGIGIANAAKILQLDYWIMAKGVQDFARPVLGENDKNDDYRDFAAYSSALFVVEFLRRRLSPMRGNTSEGVNKRLLREAIIPAFNIEELELLCSDIEQDLADDGTTLQVNLEIVGGNGKRTKVLNLIDFLYRRHHLSYLLNAIYRTRPDFKLEK